MAGIVWAGMVTLSGLWLLRLLLLLLHAIHQSLDQLYVSAFWCIIHVKHITFIVISLSVPLLLSAVIHHNILLCAEYI